jgi:hypothetical protein
MEAFYSNPDSKTQCKDLPYHVENPNHYDKPLDVFLVAICALIDAIKEEFL